MHSEAGLTLLGRAFFVNRSGTVEELNGVSSGSPSIYETFPPPGPGRKLISGQEWAERRVPPDQIAEAMFGDAE